jgi:hypothetical protein
MWRQFGRRRTGRAKALEEALSALGNVRGRYGRSRSSRRGGRRAYGNAVGLGMGLLAIVMMAGLLFWLLRRGARGTASVIPEPEEGVEAVPPEEDAVPSGRPSAEDVPSREEPPPGEERSERRGTTPTAPPSPREEPPPGEERPGR